ncbi:MAG: polyprenyl synthetase family protein [Candidatus Heimdallarchaeota archaeon]|nr:polyprenyl synthetase family protein [Candidatus Heimdallarchaeota archaeon]
MKNFLQEKSNDLDNPFLEYFYKEIERFLFSGGKRIRPVLMFFSSAAINPEVNEEGIIKASLSLELLHNASLIHDDIMDNAETRRGISAFHKTLENYSQNNYNEEIQNPKDFGIAMGILGGDFMYNIAYSAIHVNDFPPDKVLQASLEFNQGFFRVVRGVIVETDFMGKFTVSEDEYIDMVTGKTAALFESAAKMGAILAGAEESQLKDLGDFARAAGIAFQIVDDIIGTFGDPKKTGKPTDSDLKEGKKTLLLIKTIEKANDKQTELMKKIVGNRDSTSAEIEQVRNIMRDTGALDYARKQAEKLYHDCMGSLDKIHPPLNDKYKNFLLEIAKMGIHREK